MISFEIAEIPASKSNGYRIGGKALYKSKKVAQSEATLKSAAKIMAPIEPSISDNISVRIYLTLPTKRRRDIDNVAKSVLDSMIGIIYKDDSQVSKLYIERCYEKGISKTKIIIEGE